ncbi:MAG TPA: phenylalanine--tRNA ligase subunit alpha [Acidimicrobiia bacterium]|nr:phenylalanine--tRNA ligase subunit alpha [Acidimicrobiia bacterium]
MSADALRAALEGAFQAAEAAIAAAEGTADLDRIDREFLGKSSIAASTKDEIKGLDPPDRPVVGKALNEFRSRLAGLLDVRRAGFAGADATHLAATEYEDVTVSGSGTEQGHLHLVTQVQQELEDLFVGFGYRVAEGPEVETDWYNFGALNMPEAHPARSMWDTLYARLGAPEQVLLRTHTSPVQIRVMEEQEPPIYVVAPGRCYRKETLDARHSPMFHQIEGLVVDRGITFGDLAGTIEAFTQAYFGEKHHARLRPSYFPFTEPSAEFEVTCIFCEGSGCSTCSQSGWIELGGCGMVDPNVFDAVGIDSEVWSGFAFGFGLERMAMIRFGIDHIKTFFENDVRFLAQF